MTDGTPTRRTDREYKAARHLLLASRLARTARAYITPHDIDLAGLMDECYTPSEILICKAANTVWNGQGNANLYDLAVTLDEQNMKAVIEAIIVLTDVRPGPLTMPRF